MWRTCTGPLNVSLVSSPPKPFSLGSKGTLCQALKLSSWTHDCQPVVNPQAMPAALSFSAAAATSGHVLGGAFGSRPAFLNASLLIYITCVELLYGIDSKCPCVSE